MPYNRGDIIEIVFDLPYSDSSPSHPFIIISNDEVFNEDGMYICVMMTHMTHTDKFTFEITDDMLVKGGDGKFSQARCHLITNVLEKDIIINKNRNSMKSKSVDRLVTHIQTVALSL